LRRSPSRFETGLPEAAEAAVANAEPLAKNGYKLPLFRGLITDELEKIAAG